MQAVTFLFYDNLTLMPKKDITSYILIHSIASTTLGQVQFRVYLWY